MFCSPMFLSVIVILLCFNYRDDEHHDLSLPGGDRSRLTFSAPPAFITLAGWRNIIGAVDYAPPKSDLVRLGFN